MNIGNHFSVPLHYSEKTIEVIVMDFAIGE